MVSLCTRGVCARLGIAEVAVDRLRFTAGISSKSIITIGELAELMHGLRSWLKSNTTMEDSCEHTSLTNDGSSKSSMMQEDDTSEYFVHLAEHFTSKGDWILELNPLNGKF